MNHYSSFLTQIHRTLTLRSPPPNRPRYRHYRTTTTALLCLQPPFQFTLLTTHLQLPNITHPFLTNQQNPPLSNNSSAGSRYASVFRLSTTTRNPLTVTTHHDLLSKNETTAPHPTYVTSPLNHPPPTATTTNVTTTLLRQRNFHIFRQQL